MGSALMPLCSFCQATESRQKARMLTIRSEIHSSANLTQTFLGFLPTFALSAVSRGLLL